MYCITLLLSLTLIILTLTLPALTLNPISTNPNLNPNPGYPNLTNVTLVAPSYNGR